jgi:cystathionine beta-lyase/cystathionine gamma-synthase
MNETKSWNENSILELYVTLPAEKLINLVTLMEQTKMLSYVKNVLENMPSDWLHLTTHRLDIYNEKLAKTEFLDQFERLFSANNATTDALKELRTAYDYIRLGHPLSCVLEWAIAKLHNIKTENVISFSSKTTPILAVLRKNLLEKQRTQIAYVGKLPAHFDAEIIKKVYGYHFDLVKVNDLDEVTPIEGSTIFITHPTSMCHYELRPSVDFYIHLDDQLGSILLVNGDKNQAYISDIQHVRRRETIAMTPANTLKVLQLLTNTNLNQAKESNYDQHKSIVLNSIKEITNTNIKALVASSGLSIQYVIVMGLIHDAIQNYPGKAIKIVVPPNCYGGTNDQARRIEACLDNVEVLDLPVDGGNNMVACIDELLEKIAQEDAIPYIIAEIPTNPRVEVPDLIQLRGVLSKERKTSTGALAIDPVFILDQTFCPNVHFLGENNILSTVRTIAYVSGSKFPSGGKCTAGYCVSNEKAKALMEKIELHLQLCDNEATPLQMEILAKQLPSMNQRIQDAYKNTRDFVNFISETLPEAKINFVSEELAQQGFTPSVFSLDLPTKGNTPEEKEEYKKALNLKLINKMITEIPTESKYCVSYGQLKGCYWTIPATSTQGTTKEDDKDYIARVALSPSLDLELHKKVFLDFVQGMV